MRVHTPRVRPSWPGWPFRIREIGRLRGSQARRSWGCGRIGGALACWMIILDEVNAEKSGSAPPGFRWGSRIDRESAKRRKREKSRGPFRVACLPSVSCFRAFVVSYFRGRMDGERPLPPMVLAVGCAAPGASNPGADSSSASPGLGRSGVTRSQGWRAACSNLCTNRDSWAASRRRSCALALLELARAPSFRFPLEFWANSFLESSLRYSIISTNYYALGRVPPAFSCISCTNPAFHGSSW